MKKRMRTMAAALCLLLLAACGAAAEKPPESGGTELKKTAATLFLPDADAEGFETLTVQIDGGAQSLIDALAEHGAVPAGVEVIDFATEGKWGGLDVSATFEEGLSQTGSAGERMMMGALVNTFVTHFALDEIVITSEGETLKTGHDVYDAPQSFFENP